MALFALLQIPIDLTVDLLAHASALSHARGILSSCGDETWSRTEMGDPDNHFKAAETSGAEYPCPSGRSAILTYRLACRLDGRQQ